MEVALDLAPQCAPDHPWAREHRQWFTELPDAAIAYARIHRRSTGTSAQSLRQRSRGPHDEVPRVVRNNIANHGVKFFRVDNPHTKPPTAWLIAWVEDRRPDVLFLSEA